MIASAHGRSLARSRRAAAGRAVLGAVVLVALLAVFPALRYVPAVPGGVRVAGVSIEWWYGGFLAPVVGWIVAVVALKRSRDRAPHGGSPRAPSREPGPDTGDGGADAAAPPDAGR